MSMSVQLPAEIEAFVRSEVADGAAVDEAEFVSKAVQLYREMKERHAELRDHVQMSLQQAGDGGASPHDMSAIIAELRQEMDDHGTSA